MTMTPDSNTASETVMITNAFQISSRTISRPKILMDESPRMKAMTARTATANVVVRIPPPTDDGDAPMNMRMDKSNMLASENKLTSTVDRPPFRVVTDWNNESDSANQSGKSLKALLYSKMNKPTVPTAIKIKKVETVNFVNNENRLGNV